MAWSESKAWMSGNSNSPHPNVTPPENGTIAAKPADSDFPNIRQLSLTISVRSPRKNPQTNQPYQDTLTAVMNTRNLGYEKN